MMPAELADGYENRPNLDDWASLVAERDRLHEALDIVRQAYPSIDGYIAAERHARAMTDRRGR